MVAMPVRDKRLADSELTNSGLLFNAASAVTSDLGHSLA